MYFKERAIISDCRVVAKKAISGLVKGLRVWPFFLLGMYRGKNFAYMTGKPNFSQIELSYESYKNETNICVLMINYEKISNYYTYIFLEKICSWAVFEHSMTLITHAHIKKICNISW